MPATTFASRWNRVRLFIRLGRPLHLAGGFVFHGLGLAVAWHLGFALDIVSALWCQLAITATQLMTHYSNDYFDQDADAATRTPTRWASGSRVLPEGLLPPRAALAGALGTAALALLASGMLVLRNGQPAVFLGLMALELGLAWSYSSPPLWLNRRGLGELTGALLIPGLTPLLGFQVQTGQLGGFPLAILVPLCCFQFVMLLAVNFPDAAGDARVGKRTLVVALGPRRAGFLFITVLSTAYLLLPALQVGWNLPMPLVLAVSATAPLAVWQGVGILRGAAGDPGRWDPLAFRSIALLMLATVLEVIVLFVIPGMG